MKHHCKHSYILQAMCEGVCVGAIVCKLDQHKKVVRRGYIAMLAIKEGFRRRGIGKHSDHLHQIFLKS